jgi:hypothetical protein
MFKKISMLAGFGAGYVLGAKAGTQRYNEIVAKAREIAGMPAVQQATATVQDTASSLASQAKDTVNDKVTTASDKIDSKKSGGTKPTPVVDLGASGGSGAATTSTTTGATGAKPGTTAAPMAGASASTTAPDITRP